MSAEVNERFYVLFLHRGATAVENVATEEVFKQHINGDKRVIRNFDEISRIAQAMHRALAALAMAGRGEVGCQKSGSCGVRTHQAIATFALTIS